MGVAAVPFTLLGGYLGAGKTTLVNRLLAAASGSEQIAVLVNDVGAVNVDAALIADHGGETLTLTNGCVCCAIADDFTTTLETVRTMTPPPDRVVMELSGVAEPARVAPWANTTGFRLDGIVVVVDSEQFPDQLRRRFVGDAVAAQVGAADLVVLTKLDLVDGGGAGAVAARARHLVREHTSAPMVDGGGPVPVGALFGLAPVGDRDPGGGMAATSPVVSRVVDAAGLDRAGLDALLAGLPGATLRAKGLVAIDGVVHEVQVVGPRSRVRARPDRDAGSVDDRIVVIELPT